VIAHQSDLRILDVNPRWLELFEATREDVIGKTSVELGLITEDTARARVAQHGQFPDGFDIELPLRTRTGTDIIVLASAKPIEIAEGHCTLTTLIDITGRKHAEEAFATAFNASPAGMMLLHAATDTVIAVNRRFLEMTRYDRADIVGQPASRLNILHPPRAELLAKIEQTGRLENVEIQLGSKDGLGIWTLASTELITLRGAAHRISVFTDITDRKHLEDALRDLNAELEQRVADRTQELAATNRDLEAFTSSVSHDLRAPLRTIHGFSSILLVDHADELSPEVQRLLARIRAGSERLQRLIEDLLAFSRLGRTELRRTEIDLDALVASVVDELVAGRDLGDRLDLRIAPLGTCVADPTLLRAVWTNLIDNALKYARNRERIVVEIGVVERDGKHTYFVRDNGVGFDPAYADKLFGTFQRLHSAEGFEGTGIGLANVRRIVERHHGRVAATSQLGHGATFEFTLGTGSSPA
jgi:PAS domain S-box-containing protein